MRYFVAAGVLAVGLALPRVAAQDVGKAAPAWRVTEARGAKNTIKLSDFKGKWVAIEFWGFW